MTYIVVYDDDEGLCCPMTWDKERFGAIEAAGPKDPVAAFLDRNDARRSIKVSQRKAEMLEAQGEPANTDFLLPARKNIRIMRLDCGTGLPWNNK